MIMGDYIFKLPDIGEGVVEGEIVLWHVKVGDSVAEDDDIVDIMTDKATVTIPSPTSGVVTELSGEVGDMVAVGSTLVIFSADGNMETQVEQQPEPEIISEPVKEEKIIQKPVKEEKIIPISKPISEPMPAGDASQIEIDNFYATVEEAQDSIRCAVIPSGDSFVYMMPKMAPYQTIEMVAVVKISTTAKLDTRVVGLKVVSKAGDMTEGGDYDSSPSWQGENLDSNEFIVTLSLKAPDLVIKEIIITDYSADIDSTIPIGIILQNQGNTHAIDIEIVLCQYDDVDSQSIINEIQKNGCAEDSIVMRQVVGALLAPDASEDAKEIEIYLLYPVVAGSKGVYVVVDPMNEIVEGSEKNNVKAVSEPLESPNPFLDVASQVIGKTALPFVVILLTLSLLGVVYFVGKARREEAKLRIAEQSSLVSVLESED